MNLTRTTTTLLTLALTSVASTQGAAQEKPVHDVTPRILRAYDVSDLIDEERPAKTRPDKAPAVAPKPVPLLRDVPLLGELFRTKKARHLDESPRAIDSLVSFIRAFVQPGLDDGDIVNAVGGTGLVVRGSQSQHDWIASLLSRNRRTKQRMFSIELQMLQMKKPLFEARIAPVLAAHARGVRSKRRADLKARERFAMLEDSAETRRFRKSLRETDGIDMLLAPRVLMRRASAARIWCGEKVSYIKDFDIEIAKNGSGDVVADPVVDVLHDGMLFDACCATLPNGKIGLDFLLVQSDLERPIRTMKVKLFNESKLTIQLPELHLAKLETSVEFRSGQIALFALPPLDDMRVVALIRIVAVDPEPVEKGAERRDR